MNTVVINASGGGTDTGAIGNGIKEKDYTLLISKKIAEELNKKGIKTYLLRDSDKTISYDDRIRNLKDKFPNSKDVLLISNALNSGGKSGIEIIYPLKEDNKIASSLADSLSYYNSTDYFQRRSTSDTSKDYFYITKNTPGYNTIIIRYGYVDNTKDANNIKNNYLEMAETVANVISSYVEKSESISNTDNQDYYIVKKGDTLWGIAKKYNMSVSELKELNKLKTDNIQIGDKLKVSSSTYAVLKGDTLWSIAKKYNTTVEKLKEINNLKSDLLTIGTILKIN